MDARSRTAGRFPLGAAARLEQLEANPHALLARLREREPVSWLPALDGWLIIRRDLAMRVMRDPETFTVDDPRFSTGQVVGWAQHAHARRRGAPAPPRSVRRPIPPRRRARALRGVGGTGDRAADRRHRAGRRRGAAGVGKSHISVGLAMEALARGYLVRYSTIDDLVRGLRHADALGKLPGKLTQLQRPLLLILDEAGYLPLDRADANRVFQVVNRRYTRGSTIITSNKTVSEWADTFGDEALAAAILDRLLHDAEVLAINGPSFRLKGRLDALRQPADAHSSAVE